MALDLTLAKQHARIDTGADDTLVQQYLDAAILEVEKMSGRLLTRREVTQEFSRFECWLPLFWGPAPESPVVDYFDADDSPQQITDARLVRDRLYPTAEGWPSISDDSVIELTYTAGYETVPADLIHAVLVLVSGKYDKRLGAYDEAVNAAAAICGRYSSVLV